MSLGKPAPINDMAVDELRSNSSGMEATLASPGVDVSLRKTGIEVIGDVPWGTHFCQFYQTEQDLIDTLVPYFKAGLEANEFCMWVTSEPLGVEQAAQALRESVPDLDRRLAAGQIEIVPHTDWYLLGGAFDKQRVLDGWVEKLDVALRNGYAGLRLTGNTFWLEKDDWQDFTNYEEAVNSVLGSYRMLAMCTYSVDKIGAGEIADVVSNHEFAIMKRGGEWITIESSTVKQARQALQTALGELDTKTRELQGVNKALVDGADELEATNDELRTAEGQLRGEIEERIRAEEALHRLNRTLTAHSKSDQAMMRAQDESEYLNEVCRIVVEDCGHAMVWVGYAENDENKSVRPVAYSGFEEGYLETLGITWADSERGRGPTGTAIRTGKPSTCRNMLTDPQFEPWREQALKRGYGSSIVLPLASDDKRFGAMTIYSRDADPFTEDEVELLSGLADDLAYGIMAVRLRNEHVRAEQALRESEQRVRLKLDSILLPEGDIGNLELSDILNIEPIQSLMENFYKIAGIPVAIIDLKGKVLVGAGWQDICTRFHRVHPKTCKHCIESDVQLTAGAVPGESKLYKCKNNMWDIATPIMIGAEHVGNLFSGQFFFEDEPLDYGFFRCQAKRYGFNEEEYIAALERVPRLSKESLDEGMGFFIKLASLLSKLSYGNIKLARSLSERDAAKADAERRAAQLESFISSMVDGVVLFDLELKVLMINDALKSLLGAPLDLPLESCLSQHKLYTLDREPVLPEDYPSRRALRGEETEAVRFRMITPWRESVISTSGSPVKDAYGRVIGGTLSFHDVTGLVEFEEHKDELYRREHHIAEVLQNALIPPAVPAQIGDIRIGVRYLPALREAEVGGDFYDVFDLGNGKTGILIGDVAGKGLAAAIRVAGARYAVRSYALIDPRPSHVMALANEALCKDSGDEASILTAFFAVIDAATGRVTYSSAGHEPPVVCRASGTMEELQLGGLPFGVRESSTYPEDILDLAPGDTIVLVTDGITEARAGGHVLFEKTGMLDYLANRGDISPGEIASGLLEAATAYAGGQLQDDAAIVVVMLQP